MHPSIFMNIVRFMSAEDRVRVASCCRSYHRQIMHESSIESRLPVMRERLKHACWNMLHAGYSIVLTDTCAYHIKMAGGMITICYFRPNYQEFVINCTGNARKAHYAAFKSAFDMFVLADSRARMHRGPRSKTDHQMRLDPRPFVKNRALESKFAQCAQVLFSALNGNLLTMGVGRSTCK